MATRFYLRNVNATTSPTAGSKSSVFPYGTGNGTTFTNELSLLTTIGSSQTSVSKTTLAQTAEQSGTMVSRFSSEALASQTISANTWEFFFKASESNTNANAFTLQSIYIWRPSTSSVVGYIHESGLGGGSEWGTTAQAQSLSISGSQVVVQDLDILVHEWWYNSTQGAAKSYTVTGFYNGTDATTIGTGNTSTATYLETPQNLTFYSAPIQKSSIIFIM